jgi:hypothetical protein
MASRGMIGILTKFHDNRYSRSSNIKLLPQTFKRL